MGGHLHPPSPMLRSSGTWHLNLFLVESVIHGLGPDDAVPAPWAAHNEMTNAFREVNSIRMFLIAFLSLHSI